MLLAGGEGGQISFLIRGSHPMNYGSSGPTVQSGSIAWLCTIYPGVMSHLVPRPGFLFCIAMIN